MSTRVTRTILLTALAASLLMLLPSSAVAAQRIGIGFGFYGPVSPWGYWGPWGWPYGPYPVYGYYGRPMGRVQIKTPVDDAQIFINGSYAGLAHDLKKFYLTPGTYNIEQHIGRDVQRQRIFVVADRNIKLEFGKAGTPSPAPMPLPPEAAQPVPQPMYNSPYGAPPPYGPPPPPYGEQPPYGAPPQPYAAPRQQQPNAAPPQQQQAPDAAPAPESAPQSAPAPESQH